MLAGYFFPRSGRMRPLMFERDGKRIEIQPNPRVAVNDSSRAFRQPASRRRAGPDAVVHGLGNGAKDEFVSVLQDWQPATMPVHVLYPANRHLSTKVRVFVDWAAGLFAGDPCTCLMK